MRARLGRLLRRWADRIHPAGTPPTYHQTAYSYTAERTTSRNPLGVALHLKDRGCPLYILDEDWERAYAEADTDWRSPNEKLHDVFTKFGQELAEGVGKPARAYGGPVLPPQPMLYDPATDGPIRRPEDQ